MPDVPVGRLEFEAFQRRLFDHLDREFARVNGRFATNDVRFVEMQGQIVGLASRIDHLSVEQSMVVAGLKRHDERFDAIDAALKRHDQRFDVVEVALKRHDERLDRMDSRFDGIDSRFDGIDSRLDGIDSRLDRVDSRLDGIESRLGPARDS